jgi:S1-C subfamily serine protease
MSESNNRVRITPSDLAAAGSGLRREATGKAIPLRIEVDAVSPALAREPPASQSPRNFSKQGQGRVLGRSAAAVAVIFVGAAVLLSWPSQPKTNWVESIARRARESVVVIQIDDSMGAGFVVASRGREHLVLTNRHVLTSEAGFWTHATISSSCRVVLETGESLPGQLVGLPKDDEIDLALVMVRAAGLRPLGPIAAFESSHVGERVAAIGHPLGLSFTVTEGIVSAKRAGLYLQTSAVINHGNSGGPLVNEQRQVIGVNTLNFDPGEGPSYGFALRADLVLQTDKWNYLTDVSDLLRSIEN